MYSSSLSIFSITITILHVRTDSPGNPPIHSTFNVFPRNAASIHEIDLALAMQFHFLALNKVLPNSSNSLIVEPRASTNEITDKEVEEGDAHTARITGDPSPTMLYSENPATSIVNIAPCEGQKTIAILTDSKFEEMTNPTKFPYGVGGFGTHRPKKLTIRKYFNQRLLDQDGRFARDLDYNFTAQYTIESKQIFDDANNYIWRQKPGRTFTAAQARNPDFLRLLVRKDEAYTFLKNVRGSPPYYQHTFLDLLAMIRQSGTPTWFFTTSAADLQWPDMIRTIARQYGVYYQSDEEVAKLSFEERSNWLRRNPVTAARHFQYRANTFFQ